MTEQAPDLQGLARAGLAGKALSAAVLELTDPDRAQLLALMAATGAERIRVTADDDPKANLGTVSRSPGKRMVQVVDERAFLDWVARDYPQEIIRAVRDSWFSHLSTLILKEGACVDMRTGQEIPGLAIVEGEPYLVTHPSAQAKQRARDLVQRGGMRAITSGHTAEAEPVTARTDDQRLTSGADQQTGTVSA